MQYKDYIITDSISGLSRDQTELFTPQHKKFNLIITIQKAGLIRKKHFKYQYNPNYTTFKDGDGIYAIVLDALAYTQNSNISDFIKCLGFENDFKKGEKAYLACKSSYEFFLSVGLGAEEDLNEITTLI